MSFVARRSADIIPLGKPPSDPPSLFWPESERGFEKLTLDVGMYQPELGYLETGYALSEFGKLDGSYKLDGIYAAVIAEKRGRKGLLAAGAAYHATTRRGTREYWALGDVKTLNWTRGAGLHKYLVGARVLAAVMQTEDTHDVIWAPGKAAHKAEGLGFVQFPVKYFDGLARDAPVLGALSRQSLVENPYTGVGVFYLVSDKEYLELMVSLYLKGQFDLHGHKIGIGPTLHERINVRGGDLFRRRRI